MQLFHAYAAGFFDGEGSICISRAKMAKRGFQDNHRLIIDVAQHETRVSILYELQAEFGGQVRVKRQSHASFKPTAAMYNWHLQKREDVERFLRAILPMLRAKRTQAELGLEFLAEAGSSEVVRVHGRLGGRNPLTTDQIETREALRLRMRELNRPGGKYAGLVEVPAEAAEAI